MSGAVKRPDTLSVVKLGGSFAFSPYLRGILDAIAAADAPVVVVPGGGPFADAVREAQPRMGFGEAAAHRMALLAMAQFAEAIASARPRLQTAASLVAIRHCLDAGTVPVWSPWPLVDGLETLPESWDLTSDSLAAWLADRLGATRLLLLKHRDPPTPLPALHEAAEAGIVDPLFPGHAMRCGARILWVGPSGLPALAGMLDGGSAPGLSFAPAARERLPA